MHCVQYSININEQNKYKYNNYKIIMNNKNNKYKCK